jgi:ABC-type glycerol-3-phosphate transport system substrate-binding protein
MTSIRVTSGGILSLRGGRTQACGASPDRACALVERDAQRQRKGENCTMTDKHTRPNHEQGIGHGLTRRQLMKTAGWAVGTALTERTLFIAISKPVLSRAEGIAAPAVLKGTKLHLLQWISFIPPADEELRRQAEEWGKQTGVHLTIETINANDLQGRIAAALASGTGPDIIQMLHNWPHLYTDGCLDVDDIAEKVEKAYGGYYKQIRDNCLVEDHYKAVPYSVSCNATTYREDWFKEVGAETFPETWDDYRKLGKVLKDQGRPFGQTFGHTFGDAPTFVYPYLWSFGGKEVEEDGKTIALDSRVHLD